MNNRTKNKKANIFPMVATIILGIVTVSAFVLQIVTTNSSSTPRETALFSIIQFILSLGFGWVLTRTITKEEYEESTKKFAIGAYRRVSDIDRMVKRLQNEVERMREDYRSEKYHALDVVNAIVIDIGETINSSISDWMDVIGDELSTLEQIQKLEDEKVTIISQPPIKQLDQTQQRLEELELGISKLVESLPPRLRYSKEKESFNLELEAQKLIERYKTDNGLQFKAFWDSSFERDPCTMKVGDKVYVSVDSVSARVGALIAKNNRKETVGVVTNNIGSSYENFVRTVGHCFRETRFTATITNIGQHDKEKKDPRHYFIIRVMDEPILNE